MPFRSRSVMCPAVWAARQLASAQTPADLGIQTYAGLTLTAAVGAVYSVEYVTDLAPTNATGYRLFRKSEPRGWLNGHGCFSGLKTLNLGLVPIQSL